MPSSDIFNWLSRVVTGRDMPAPNQEGEPSLDRPTEREDKDEWNEVPAVGKIRLDDRPDNYYLRTTYPPSEDEGSVPGTPPSNTSFPKTPFPKTPSPVSSSSGELTPTPYPSSRASTNDSQATLQEQQHRQRLSRRFVDQEQTMSGTFTDQEPTIHEERLRHQETERALNVARDDLKAIQESLGVVAERIMIVAEAMRKAEDKEHTRVAVREANSVGERLNDIKANINCPIQKIHDTLREDK
ncbi:hypothetical protein ACHAPT_004627 [Fusarium lateritium]